MGATLFVVNFAIFLAKKQKAKVAAIELDGAVDFQKIAARKETKTQTVKGGIMYQYKGVDFFSGQFDCAIREQFSEYDFVIFDLGNQVIRFKEFFLKCDQRIILGSSLEWHQYEFEHFLSYARQVENYKDWEYLDVTGLKRKICFIDDGKIKLKRLAWLADPFEEADSRIRLYQSLL